MMLIEYKMKTIFSRKPFRKLGREKSSRTLFIFKKALYKVKETGQHLCFNKDE